MHLDILRQDIRQGLYLIEASAGTGKTYNIQHLFLRLLLERNDIQQIKDILVVTFTELATAELKDRIRANLVQACGLLEDNLVLEGFDLKGLEPEKIDQVPEEIDADENLIRILIQSTKGQEELIRAKLQKLQLALHSFDEASIFTIHGFCHRMLREYAFETGSLFDCRFVTDQSDLIQEVVLDFWRKYFYNLDHFLVSIINSQGIDLDCLTALADHFVRNPELKPLPDKAGQTQDRLLATWTRIKQTWENEKETIKKTLLDKKNQLSRNQKDGYPDKKIIEDSAFFDSMDQDHPQPEKIFEYAKSELDKAIKTKQKDKGVQALPHPFFDYCQKFKDQAKEYKLRIKLDLREEILSHKALEKLKQRQKVQTFDDLLFKVCSALGLGSKQEAFDSGLANLIRSQYKAALIDEFQDTDPFQYQIFQKLFDFKGHLLFLIGDPKQSIYSFRGADIFSYLSVAEKEHINLRSLPANYRSSPQIVQAVNALFMEKDKPPFVFEKISYEPVVSGRSPNYRLVINDREAEAALNLCWLSSEKGQYYNRQQALGHIHYYVANKIAQILSLSQQDQAGFESLVPELEDEKIRPRDIAVLTITNRQAQDLRQYLNETGVPAVLHSSGNLFETREATEVYRVLQAVLRPNDPGSVLTALSMSLFGLDAATLARYSLDEQTESEYSLWIRWFSRYRHEWFEHGIIRMFTKLLASEEADQQDMPEGQRQWLAVLQKENPGLRKDVRLNLMSLPDGERRLTNVRHLMEILHQEEKNQNLSPERLLRWLAGKIEEPEEASEHELRLEKDSEAVQILTVHKSKGLEFPIVFCPYMWTNNTSPRPQSQNQPYTFHLLEDGFSPQQYIALDDQSIEENKPYRDQERLAESLRLLYVALTRAKYRNYLFWGEIKNTSDTALGYLLPEGSHLPRDENIQTIYLQEIEYKYQSKGSNPLMSHLDWPDHLTVPHDWSIMSFTSLIRPGKEVHLTESRAVDEPRQAIEDIGYFESNKTPFMDFPAGRQAGEAIHDILYELEIPEPSLENGQQKNLDPDLERLIRDKLLQYGLISQPESDQEASQKLSQYLSQIYDLLSRIFKTPYSNDQGEKVVLNRPTNRYIKEMPFYFEVNRPLDVEALNRLLSAVATKDSSFPDKGDNFPDSTPIHLLKQQGGQHGLMTGSIDLVIQSDQRYYLADWKTNYLGNDLSDYNPKAIAQDMQSNGYYLQYLIYTLALHRFLRQRLGLDYDYNRDFGGGFYFYLRGINGIDDSTGVFFERLNQDLLEELDRIL